MNDHRTTEPIARGNDDPRGNDDLAKTGGMVGEALRMAEALVRPVCGMVCPRFRVQEVTDYAKAVVPSMFCRACPHFPVQESAGHASPSRL
jgi:hypothetical protein